MSAWGPPLQITYKINGLQELEKKLVGLGPAVAGKIGQNALTAGAKPIAQRMRALVPVRTGDLKKSITTRAVRAGGSILARVIGFKAPGRFYSHLVEFGTKHSAAKPFIRPAMDSGKSSSLLEIGRMLWRGIEAYSIGQILTSLKDEE